jgi:hypothetical protein
VAVIPSSPQGFKVHPEIELRVTAPSTLTAVTLLRKIVFPWIIVASIKN